LASTEDDGAVSFFSTVVLQDMKTTNKTKGSTREKFIMVFTFYAFYATRFANSLRKVKKELREIADPPLHAKNQEFYKKYPLL
jgi:hypothetical protein